MPPLKDCKVKDPTDPRNIKEHRRVLAQDESTFLIQPNQKKRGQDEEMAVEQQLTYTLESKDIVDRAIKKKPITNVCDLKYLMEVKNRQDQNKSNALHDRQKRTFLGYSSNIMRFVEGKYFSKST